MTIRAKTTLSVLVLMGALTPGTAAARPCTFDETILLSCTVEGGARTLNLCLAGDTLHYAFGPTGGTPTLEMTRSFADVAYTPFAGTGATIYENVTLYNGNYGYEMFTSSRLRVDPDAKAEGGIIVRLPGGETQTLTCDAGAVQPDNPFDGIGQLALLMGDGQDDPLGYCLERLSPAAPASTCLGRLRERDITRETCDPATDKAQCWGSEVAAWETLVDARFAAALAYLPTRREVIYVETFKVAQDAWKISRNLDCDIYGPNPFAGDGGKAECRAQYAARRVTFLQEIIAQAEFDG